MPGLKGRLDKLERVLVPSRGPRRHVRVVIGAVYGTPSLATSTCQRRLTNGALTELVNLDGSRDELSADQPREIHRELSNTDRGQSIVRILRRIELLEEALLPVEYGPPLAVRVNFVERDGTVVETRVFTVGSRSPEPLYRGWRAARRSWPARRPS